MPTYEEYGFPKRPRRFRDSPAPWSVVLLFVALVAIGAIIVGYLVFAG